MADNKQAMDMLKKWLAEPPTDEQRESLARLMRDNPQWFSTINAAGQEKQGIPEQAISSLPLAAPSPAAPLTREPVAWLHCGHPTAYVITDRVKQMWLACKAEHVELYTIPLCALDSGQREAKLKQELDEARAQIQTAYGYGNDKGAPPWMK